MIKIFKKVFCIVLALAMVFALSVPAFASTNASLTCPSCGHVGGHTVVNGTVIKTHSYISVGGCLNYSANHQHTQLGKYRRYRCPSCASQFDIFYDFAGVTCPYGSLRSIGE